MKSLIQILRIFLIAFSPIYHILAQQTMQWENHVSYNEVNCMLDFEDSIWVGTNGGLASINKATLSTRYYNKMNCGLKDCVVHTLVKTKDDIYLGTDCGLVLYQLGNWVNYNTQNSILTTNIVTALYYSEPLLTVCVGLEDGNVIRIDSTGWNLCIGTTILKPASTINRIIIDTALMIWVGTTGNYLYKFNGNNWIHYTSSSPPWLSHYITELFVDPSGKLYCGDIAGLYNYTANNTWHVSYVGSVFPYHITNDNLNTLWISNRLYGLTTYAGGTLTNQAAINAMLTSIDLTSHVIDNQFTWTGSFENGVDQVNGLNVVNIPLEAGLPGNNINDIEFDTAGIIWMDLTSNTHAFCSYDGNSWNEYSPANTILTSNTVSALTLDSNSVLWLGTEYSGLFTCTNGIWSKYTTITSNIASDNIREVSTDCNNNILIGFNNGMVQLFANNTFSTVISPGIIGSNVLNKIIPENTSKFWIATDTAGLISCDYIGTTIFNTSNSGIPSQSVRDLIKDPFNHYWIATQAGLAKFDGSWTVYNAGNSGLPENNLTSLSLGKDSSLWIGTRSSGLVRYKSAIWTVYNKCNSMLVSNSVNTLKTANDGRIFIGTANGLSILTLDNITGEPAFQKQKRISVHPNPASGQVNFDIFMSSSTQASIHIFNFSGQEIMSQNIPLNSVGSASFNWDTQNTASAVPNGIYFYSIIGDWETISGKLVISR